MLKDKTVGSIMVNMNDIQEILENLKGRGWTWAAISDEIGVEQNTVSRWYAGTRYPTNVVAVKALLEGLKRRSRVPKKWRPRVPKKRSS